MDKISFTREGGLAVFKPVSFLGGERFNEYRKATEGSTFDFKRKVGLATIDKLPGILKRLREADFEAELTEDLTLALSEHTTQLWLDVQGAKDRVELIDAEIRERNKTPQGLFPFQKTGAAWLAMKHGALLADEQGTGKAQPIDTLLLTPNGEKRMGDLRPGDLVYGSSRKPIRVVGVYPQGFKPVFRLQLRNAASTRCCLTHWWTVQICGETYTIPFSMILERAGLSGKIAGVKKGGFVANDIEIFFPVNTPEGRVEWNKLSSVFEEESTDCVCISVDAPDCLYMVEDGILTHNTLQTIAALPARTATLVVAPAVAKGVWRREIKRWRPALRTAVLHGRGSFRWPEVGEAVIVNYELLPEAHTEECLAKRKSKVKVFGEHKKDCLKAQRNVFIPAVAELAKRCKGCLLESDLAKRCKGCAPFLETVPENLTMVADEGHALKNPNAQRTVRFRGISRKCRARHGRVWVLTGTPLLNKPPELWSVLDAAEVAESAFGSFKGMVEMFGGKSKHFGGFDWGQPDEVKIATGMQAVMLRRLREEVMPELPKKTVQLWPVEISGTLSKACDAAVEKYGGMDAIQNDLKKGVSFGTLARVRAALATAKIDAMLQLVEEHEEENEPVVVFSAHRAPIDLLGHRPGWRVITGDTTPEERTEIEDQFQAGKLRGVGSTIKAGGVAITLTRACFAIFVDLEWTPGLNQQAEDRIVRIGQERAVLIRVLVAEHKLDERIAELLEEKTDIIDASVNAARERV